MRKPGTDESNVQMSDVLCDFCHREWSADVPMLEGHHGSCVCGRCLTVAYARVVLRGENEAPADFKCPMCLEDHAARASLDRGEEAGWPSPAYPEAVMCRRCIELAAKALHRDRDTDWTRPTLDDS